MADPDLGVGGIGGGEFPHDPERPLLIGKRLDGPPESIQGTAERVEHGRQGQKRLLVLGGDGPARPGRETFVDDVAGPAEPDHRLFLVSRRVVPPADALEDPAFDEVDGLGHAVRGPERLDDRRCFVVGGPGRGPVGHPFQHEADGPQVPRQVKLDRVGRPRPVREGASDVDRLAVDGQGIARRRRWRA